MADHSQGFVQMLIVQIFFRSRGIYADTSFSNTMKRSSISILLVESKAKLTGNKHTQDKGMFILKLSD